LTTPAERPGTKGRTPVKSAGAFRTISEVSVELEVPQHVLRFWETKFPQVRPLKRGGGRRYYRPEDVDLLRRIQRLLYGEGYTIKGVQRLLRDPHGTSPEADDLEDVSEDDLEDLADHHHAGVVAPGAEEEPEARFSAEQRAELEAILAELEELRELLQNCLEH